MTELSIILPTYNEKDNIILLVNKIIRLLKNYKKKEIIIVDDSSPDNTYSLVKKKFKTKKFIKTFLRKKEFSLGKAIRYGIKKSKGRLIIVMDTDLTHNPNLIPKLISQSKNYDFVSGSRFVKGGSMYSLFHYTNSLIFSFFLKILLKTKLNDNLGGYFCIKSKTLKRLKFKKIFYGYGEYYFKLLFFLNKNKVSMIEISAHYGKRNAGESKSSFMYLLFKYSLEAITLRLKNIS